MFNQFDEFGNAIWHYHVTGTAVIEVFDAHFPDARLAAFVSATGSAGTIAAGDFLRTRHPGLRVVAAEAQQSPTLFGFGYGEHRIEGIGDKHVPWIHNVRNTDVVTAIDDEAVMQLVRLFNEPAGRELLVERGVPEAFVSGLGDIGISCICNLLASIKTAKHFDLGGRDVLFTPLTDSMELYDSRLDELRATEGAYTREQAVAHFARYLEGAADNFFRELTYADRKALHHFKYFTWVEQQGKTSAELEALWDPDFWSETFSDERVAEWDRRIDAFNAATGVLAGM